MKNKNTLMILTLMFSGVACSSDNQESIDMRQNAILEDAIESDTGKMLVMAPYKTIDEDDNDYVSKEELINYGNSVHYSMDGDDDSQVSLDEFLFWGFGLQDVAANKERERAYKTGLTMVHTFWDKDGNSLLSQDEQRQSISDDFTRSDQNSDNVLSQKEYLLGFPVNVAFRTALKD